jgi:VWFA-related protein
MVRGAVAGLLFGATVIAAAQQPPIVHGGTSAVVVDVIVRDGKGNPVTGLSKNDFELFEDGVRQTIGDVTIVGSAPRQPVPVARTATPAPTAPAGKSSGRPDTPRFTALVFDRLSPEARAGAYKGALAAVDAMHDGDYFAVYVADLSLITVQNYTSDREKVRAAVKDVASRATSVFDRTSMTAINKIEKKTGDAHPSTPWVASAESVGRPVDTRASADRVPSEIGIDADAVWERLARDQQGYATTDDLLAVVAALGTLPGRKTVVFFAEGLAIPDAVLTHFRNVVTTANRANVSVYTIDAAGLRVHSKDQENYREIHAMGNSGLALDRDGNSQSSIRMLERNEDVLRKDPRTSLTLLANQTGGFLVENTNDLATGFARIDTDRRFYYLLTYEPNNTRFDGEWRSIRVNVPNRHVTVRARTGYLAVRAPAGEPLLAYEAAALADLDRSPAPADLPLRSTALVFPGGRLAILAATDAAALGFSSDDRTHKYRTDFTVLARILDANGRVVRKASQPYRLGGPVEQIEQARGGEILFFRNPTLPEGRYTVEVALHDALTSRAAVQRQPLLVPPAGDLQVSSLLIVRRAERVKAEERQADNPLSLEDVLIYPSLGEPVRKSQQHTIPLYFTMIVAAGLQPSAVLEVSQDGRALAQLRIPLSAPDALGRIGQISSLPIDSVQPGRYTVRLTITQGERHEMRYVSFDLTD